MLSNTVREVNGAAAAMWPTRMDADFGKLKQIERMPLVLAAQSGTTTPWLRK
jgi:hypothetical protein